MPVHLGVLADHGGTTWTRLPLANSPAVNSVTAGTVGLCDAGAVDQRGIARPVGAACDRGSVEGSAGAPAGPLALVVDSAADTRDAFMGDGICDDGTGACTLRAAIDETNANLYADHIQIAAGIDPVLTRAGTDEDLNATGDLDVRDAVEIEGVGSTIDAAGLDRVIHVLAGPVTVESVTLTGGRRVIVNDGSLRGSAIRSVGDLVLRDVRSEGNGVKPPTASWEDDTAIVVVGHDLELDRTVVHEEEGALTADRLAGLSVIGGDLRVSRSAVRSTRTAIDAGAGSTVTIDRSTIDGSSLPGATTRAIQSAAAVPVVVRRSTLLSSGIVVSGGATTTVSGSVLLASTYAGQNCGISGTVSGGYNVVNDGSCAFGLPTDRMVGADPIGGIGDHGGSTWTALPIVGSVVMNAIPVGTVGLCDAAVPVDQRGSASPVGGACEIGSVEDVGFVQPALALVVNTGWDAFDANPGDGICRTTGNVCSLRAAVDEAEAWPGADLITIATGVTPKFSTYIAPGAPRGELLVTEDLRIDGNGGTLDINFASRGFVARRGTLTINDLTLTHGRLVGGDHSGGGAILVYAALSVDHVTFTDDGTQSANGGAIAVMPTAAFPSPVAAVSNSTFHSVIALGNGGGIYNGGGILTVRNSTFTAVQATYGSAVASLAAGTTTLTGVTIASVTSVPLYGAFTMSGSIVQSSGAFAACYGPGMVRTSGGHNIVNDTSCGMTAPTDRQSTVISMGALAANGGPTKTMLPAVGSVAIDAIPVGTPGLCDGTTPPDQRGVTRPLGAACDIGATEQ